MLLATFALFTGLCAGPLQAPVTAGGAVSSSEAHATRAGVEILAAGGNAVDAAVAVGFALAVTWPAAGNLGGGGFLLYRAPDGEAHFLDFREVAPAAAHPNLYRREDGSIDKRASVTGWKAVGVPGSVPGMLQAHARWGKLDRGRILAPAIRLASEGFPITEREHRALSERRSTLGRDVFAGEVFYRDGHALGVGERLVQTRLAETLRAIADQGEAALRAGPIVEAIVARSREAGGILTAEDFRDYQAIMRPVHRFAWRGMEVLTTTAPSSGAVFLHQCLTVLEGFPLSGWGVDHPRTVLAIAEVTAHAFSDRNRWLGDPAGFDFDWRALVSEDHLRARREALSADRYTRPQALQPYAFSESEETTHFSVVDAWGGAVSVTTTINGSYGAKVMAPGGFLMNNEMDDFASAPGTPNQFGLVQSRYNAVTAGRRPLSSMCPTILVRDGQLEAVVGSPGGPRILTSVLQVLLHRYVFGMTPRQAVAAPRLHRQDRPSLLYYERGRLKIATLDALRSRGQPLRYRRAMGAVNAIFRWQGSWAAVSDPRRGGLGSTVR